MKAHPQDMEHNQMGRKTLNQCGRASSVLTDTSPTRGTLGQEKPCRSRTRWAKVCKTAAGRTHIRMMEAENISCSGVLPVRICLEGVHPQRLVVTTPQYVESGIWDSGQTLLTTKQNLSTFFSGMQRGSAQKRYP